MSIKKSTYAKQSRAIDILHAQLNNILSDNYFNDLPQSIREQIETFQERIKKNNYETETNIQVLNGKTATEKEILDLIVQATGYTKWVLEDTIEVKSARIEEIKKQYAVTFDTKKIVQYMFSRNVNSRDDINMITVMALPGYFKILMDTDRADVSIEELITSEEAVQKIEENL